MTELGNVSHIRTYFSMRKCPLNWVLLNYDWTKKSLSREDSLVGMWGCTWEELRRNYDWSRLNYDYTTSETYNVSQKRTYLSAWGNVPEKNSPPFLLSLHRFIPFGSVETPCPSLCPAYANQCKPRITKKAEMTNVTSHARNKQSQQALQQSYKWQISHRTHETSNQAKHHNKVRKDKFHTARTKEAIKPSITTETKRTDITQHARRKQSS